jgi:hypothetical protein
MDRYTFWNENLGLLIFTILLIVAVICGAAVLIALACTVPCVYTGCG